MKKLILLLSVIIFCLEACQLPSSTVTKTDMKTSKTANSTANKEPAASTTTKAPHVVQWEIDHPKMLGFIKANEIDSKWLESGLYYSIANEGTGAAPTLNSVVNVSYTLSDLDGNLIWSTDQGEGVDTRALSKFPPGVSEGLQLIKEGGQIKLIVPSALAYGNAGWGKQIPPNTCLYYDIRLISINDTP